MGVIPGVAAVLLSRILITELKLRRSLSKKSTRHQSRRALRPRSALPWTLEGVESGSARVDYGAPVDDVLDSTLRLAEEEGGFVKSWKRRWFVLHRGICVTFPIQVDGNAW